ncbi:hypothetical protein Q8A73_012412 [Channa argus]|nr:hypothetical protein Q8A73_012412 [Channa argus]
MVVKKEYRVKLPIYLCTRGSTSLESFHMQLCYFVPGRTRARQKQPIPAHHCFVLCPHGAASPGICDAAKATGHCCSLAEAVRHGQGSSVLFPTPQGPVGQRPFQDLPISPNTCLTSPSTTACPKTSPMKLSPSAGHQPSMTSLLLPLQLPPSSLTLSPPPTLLLQGQQEPATVLVTPLSPPPLQLLILCLAPQLREEQLRLARERRRTRHRAKKRTMNFSSIGDRFCLYKSNHSNDFIVAANLKTMFHCAERAQQLFVKSFNNCSQEKSKLLNIADVRRKDRNSKSANITALSYALMGLHHQAYVTQQQALDIVALWLKLSDRDKAAVSFFPRHQDRLVKGHFKTSQSAHTAGIDNVQSSKYMPDQPFHHCPPQDISGEASLYEPALYDIIASATAASSSVSGTITTTNTTTPVSSTSSVAHPVPRTTAWQRKLREEQLRPAKERNCATPQRPTKEF